MALHRSPWGGQAVAKPQQRTIGETEYDILILLGGVGSSSSALTCFPPKMHEVPVEFERPLGSKLLSPEQLGHSLKRVGALTSSGLFQLVY